MSKFFKTIFIAALFFLVISIINFSFADNSVDSSQNVAPNPSLTDQSTTQDSATVKNPIGNSNSNQNSNTTTSSSSQPSAKITTLSESTLQLSNILNIILIVLGTLLVLLSIAILIRLKR